MIFQKKWPYSNQPSKSHFIISFYYFILLYHSIIPFHYFILLFHSIIPFINNHRNSLQSNRRRSRSLRHHLFQQFVSDHLVYPHYLIRFTQRRMSFQPSSLYYILFIRNNLLLLKLFESVHFVSANCVLVSSILSLYEKKKGINFVLFSQYVINNIMNNIIYCIFVYEKTNNQ